MLTETSTEITPTVSVVIPTYNRSVTVRQAIRSTFTQSMAPLEVIVVDDGSTDSTGDVVAREQERLGQRLRLLTQEHGERSVARNRGVEAARGDYIAFLDSDDLWRANHLEASLNALRTHPEVIGTIADYGLLSVDGRIVRDHVSRTTENGGRDRRRTLEGDYHAQLRALVRQDIIVHPSEVVVSRAALLSAGGFNLEVVGSEDWLLWVQLASAGELLLTYQPTVWLRHSPDNTFSRPRMYADGMILAAEHVIATGLPGRVGVPDDLVRAIAYADASAAYARARLRRHSVAMLTRAIGTYPRIVFEPRSWIPARRLLLGGSISDAISRRRWSPSERFASEALETAI